MKKKLLNEKECIKLWAEDVNVLEDMIDSNRPEDYLISNPKTVKRTEHLVRLLKEMHNKGYQFSSLHEIGCNVGRNLIAIKKQFTEMKLSGNDVNAKAFAVGDKFYGKDMNGITLWLESTQDFIRRKVHFDVVISMAHILHLPHSCDELLKKRLPEICNILILYEPKQNHDDSYIFGRDFPKFFGIKPIKKFWRPVREINRAYVFDFRRN